MTASSKNPVYIIIPVHNRKVTTVKCLDNLVQTGDLQRYQIIVVDDGSTDGTANVIRRLYPDVIVLSGDGDLWWTGGTALGMQYAHDQDAKFLIWMNDDCMPLPGALPGLIEFMKTHPCSLVAPVCYSEKLEKGSVQHNGFKKRHSYAAKPGETIRVDGISGWCVGMPIEVVHKVGLPDTKRFPHYSGDDMYTLRATKAGFSAYLLGDLSVILFGPVHEKLNFRDYFQPERTSFQVLRALFWDKKSPYRLPTRFFVFTERYGAVLGIFLFVLKVVTWSLQYSKLQIYFWLSSRQIPRK